MAQCWAISANSLVGVGSPSSTTSTPTPHPGTAKRKKIWNVRPAGRETHCEAGEQVPAQAQRPVRPNLSSHMAPEHLKCEQSKLGCAPSAKSMPGFKDSEKRKSAK